MLNINPKEMLCAFPAGVVECQCPCYTASSSERLGVCSQDTLLLMPPSSYSSIRLKKKEREKKSRNLDLSTLEDRNREQKSQFDLLM